MNIFRLLISLSSYILILIIGYYISNNKYKKSTIVINGVRTYGSKNTPSSKMTLIIILIISLLFSIYNVIITKMSVQLSGDRYNYTRNYYGITNAATEGMAFVIDIIRKFSNNPEMLFYVSTFSSVFFVLLAYRIDYEATPSTLIFLFSTQYVFFSFAGLKQCYTNGLAALSIAFALRNKNFLDSILSILCAYFACWFHPTGYIIIPLLIMIKMPKKRKSIILFFFFIFILLLFFQTILLKTAGFLAPINPSISNKIYEYIGETANEALKSEGYLALFKGLPYYIITVVGLIKRKEIIDKINNYDNYLLLSAVLSLSYLATIYNGWLYRVAYLLYFPSGVFFVRIMKHYMNNKDRKMISFAVFGLNAMFTIRFVGLIYINYGGF